MAYIRYIKNNHYDWFYQYLDSDSDEIYVIGMFLTDDAVQFGIQCYCDWAIDDPSDHNGGNVTWLDKEDGFIIVSDAYSQRDDGGPYGKILPQEFVNLLNQWQKVFEQKPKEIIITEIDGVYSVIGRE